MWSKIEILMGQDLSAKWCLVRDWNAVRNSMERKGRGTTYPQSEIRAFDEFIEKNDLIDLPQIGREFTWYKHNLRAMSRIDRFLLSDTWMQQWSNLTKWALFKDISYHCPLVLKKHDVDWGPRPFRVMDCWHDHSNFREFVENTWNSFQIEGWAGFRFKEKLKRLKLALKEWNKSVFEHIDENIDKAREELNHLDLEPEQRDLTSDEEERRRHVTTVLWQQLKAKENILQQKSRVTWLRKGDSNSRFFQRCINGRAANNLNGLTIAGNWTQEPGEVKKGVEDHFRDIFSETWEID